jgi:hypothetical protein
MKTDPICTTGTFAGNYQSLLGKLELGILAEEPESHSTPAPVLAYRLTIGSEELHVDANTGVLINRFSTIETATPVRRKE